MQTMQVIHLCFWKFHIWALIIQAGDAFPHTYQLSMESRKQCQNHISLIRAIPSYFSQTRYTTSPLHIMHTTQVCHTLGNVKTAMSNQNTALWLAQREEGSAQGSSLGRTMPLLPDWNQPPSKAHFLALVNNSVTEQISLQCDQWLRNPDYQLGRDLLLKNSTQSIFRGTASFGSGR